jgi:hypothetical protein
MTFLTFMIGLIFGTLIGWSCTKYLSRKKESADTGYEGKGPY